MDTIIFNADSAMTVQRLLVPMADDRQVNVVSGVACRRADGAAEREVEDAFLIPRNAQRTGPSVSSRSKAGGASGSNRSVSTPG